MWGLGLVWIGDLGEGTGGEWGLGPESGVGVRVRRLVPAYTMFWVSQVWCRKV